MASKYVPPRLRNQQQDPQPPPPPQKTKEEEFPSLTTSTNSNSAWAGKKKFSDLAYEWSVKANEEKVRKEIEEAVRVHEQHTNLNAPMPKFYNVGRFIEPEEDEDGYMSSGSEKKEEDDGWVEVKRKIRKERDLTEFLNRPPTPEEEKVKWEEAVNEEEDYWRTD